MFCSSIPLNFRVSWRKKARANICIAKELADIFGGAEVDYLKRLNCRLRMKIQADTVYYYDNFAKAA